MASISGFLGHQADFYSSHGPLCCSVIHGCLPFPNLGPLLLHQYFFGSTTYRILAPQPGIKSMPLRWKCKVLTTKLPENSLSIGISNVFVSFYWKYGNVFILKISREAMEIWRYYLKPTFGHTLQSLLIHLPAQHGLLWGYQSPWRDMRSFQIHTLLIYSLNTLTLQCILSPGKKKRRHEDRWRKKEKKRKRTEEQETKEQQQEEVNEKCCQKQMGR